MIAGLIPLPNEVPVIERPYVIPAEVIEYIFFHSIGDILDERMNQIYQERDMAYQRMCELNGGYKWSLTHH